MGETGQAPNRQELGGTGQALNQQELGGTGQALNQQEVVESGQAPNRQELGGTGQALNQQKSSAKPLMTLSVAAFGVAVTLELALFIADLALRWSTDASL
ncbi:MAG: hypothetical protein RBU37_06510, partial [Myxococcota bacterium]|nr:hypothetical protein [Myxococcota bacterium]